ncbi:MAG: hypothetical protein NVSMB47_14630 [Polyangiales bacterium]
MSPTVTAAAPPKFKRSARNYLLDSRFQLKWTGYIVGVTLVVSIALGYLLFRQTSKTVEIGNDAVAVGAEANKAGKEAVEQSTALNTKLEMDAMKQYGDDPVLMDAIRDANKDQTAQITARAAKLESTKASLDRQKQALEQQQTTLMIILVAGLGFFVAAIGAAGIVVTHKIAGPIFKMKRLLREVGEGKFVVQSRLRKGDEMQDLFEIFATMVERLRHRQEDRIKLLDAALEQATTAHVDEAAIARVRQVRTMLQAELDAKMSRPPGP